MAAKSTTRFIWPSIACISLGGFAWSSSNNYNKHKSSLEEMQSQIINLRQIINSQNHSINQQQAIISSTNHKSSFTGNQIQSSANTSSYSPIIKAISPSIVNLVIESEQTVNFGFFQIQQPTKQLGTGVIIRSDGIIITNNHVVTTSDFNEDQIITVYLSNSRKVEAHIILKDELNDLALLKINSENEIFPCLEIGDASDIEVGDRVLAIGNNLGLHNTVTDGIISAIGRAQASQIENEHNNSMYPEQLSGVKISKNPYLPFLQISASINQGSSGGALIDINTQKLIGINTAIASPIGVHIGIGFAIPSSYVLSMLRSLEYNHIVRPWDGMDVMKQIIGIDVLSKDAFDRINGLMNKTHSSYYIDGVEIVEMHKDSPALKGGVCNGDVLIMMNNKIEIDSMDKYWIALNGFVPNEIVNYLVLRWNEQNEEYDLMDFDVSIMEPPKAMHDNVLITDSKNAFNGCLFGELQPSLGIELGINPSKEGVMLMDFGYSSFAAHAGFQTGDLLLEIDDIPIDDLEKLEGLNVDRNRPHKVVLQRGDMVGQLNI